MNNLATLEKAVKKTVAAEAAMVGSRPEEVEVSFTADMTDSGDLVVNRSRRFPGATAITMKFTRQEIPEAVRLLSDYAATLATSGQKKLTQNKLNKIILYKRQEGYCNGCGYHFQLRNLTIDHKLPKSRGGRNDIGNLQLLCHACNQLKADGSEEQLMAELRERGDLA